jgi:hypothetical protein
MSQNIHTNETGGSNDSCLNGVIRTVSSGACGVAGGVVTTAAGGSTGLAACIGGIVCACTFFRTRPRYSEIVGRNNDNYHALPPQGPSTQQQASAPSEEAMGSGLSSK